MFDRFPDDAKRVMLEAWRFSAELGHDYIGTEHILVGLCRNHFNRASWILAALGVDPGTIRAEVEQVVKKGNAHVFGQLPFTPGAKRALEEAMYAASARGDDYIGTELLLLGLIAERKGIAAKVLAKLGVDAARARGALDGLDPQA